MHRKVMFVWMIAILVANAPAAASAIGYDARGPHPLEGSWRLVGMLAENDDVIEPVSFEEIKLVTDRGFEWARVEHGRMVRGAGGHARFGRSTYVEIVDHVLGENLSWMIGKRLKFNWKLRDGLWYHIGSFQDADGRPVHVAEVWERIR